MHGWTDEELRVARKLGVPAGTNSHWWWRARHVLNSPERVQLEAFTQWLRRRYSADLARCRFRVV